MSHQGQRKLPQQPIKRKLLTLLGLAPWLSACQATQSDQDMSDGDLMRKFRGIGGTTVLFDSVSEHHYVRFVTDTGRVIASPSGLSRGGRQNLNFSGDSLPVPKTVRVTWKEGDVKNDFPRGWLGGTVVGDFTVEVARRIPAEAIEDLRRDPKGQLRIKFRLTEDGVLFGWDIERRPGYDPKGGATSVPPVFSFTGGDFKEARGLYVSTTRTFEKGWYINKKTGQKIETDF
jgi:hypothetical protein